MDEGVASGSAFHVTIDDNNELLWTTEMNGSNVEFDTDPGTSMWQRFVADVIGLLPIEDQL
jgi:putative cardiolipin synthase